MLREVFHGSTRWRSRMPSKTRTFPKVDDWAKYLYIVVDTIDFDPETDEIRLHELDLFLGKNYLVTYHNEATDILDPAPSRNLEREL